MRQALRSEAAFAAAATGGQGLVEKRTAPRFTLLIRAAKLITPEGEFLCVIRDASESGVSVRIFHALPDCGGMLVELQNGDRYELELIWQEQDRAGFRFTGPTDIARIIESPSRFSKRPIRLNLEAAAEIETGGRIEGAKVLDISQQGAKISCNARFSIDQRVKLRAPGMRETHAKVRWRRDDTCGLIFEDTYQFGELARIVELLQRDMKIAALAISPGCAPPR